MDKEKKKRNRTGPLKKNAFIEAFLKTYGNITHACQEAGIRRSVYYHWKKNDKGFRMALKSLEDLGGAELMRRGMCDRDTTALICTLKKLNRAAWDDAYARQVHALKHGLQPADLAQAPVRAVLVREAEPERLQNGALVNGNGSHVEN